MTVSMFTLEENVFVKTILSSCNVLIHILMGMIVGICLLFGLKMNYNATSVPEDIILLHILMCVPAFTLIMSQSLLGMTRFNTWSSSLSTVNKRRAHWILQILGSGLGITGCIIIMIYKDVNFNTQHGRWGLVAVIFTFLGSCSGLMALFSNKLSNFMPSALTKIPHIVLGIVAYGSAAVCLGYAFNKNMFKLWTSDNVSLAVIIVSAVFTSIILVHPFITLCKKIIKLIKSRSDKY